MMKEDQPGGLEEIASKEAVGTITFEEAAERLSKDLKRQIHSTANTAILGALYSYIGASILWYEELPVPLRLIGGFGMVGVSVYTCFDVPKKIWTMLGQQARFYTDPKDFCRWYFGAELSDSQTPDSQKC